MADLLSADELLGLLTERARLLSSKPQALVFDADGTLWSGDVGDDLFFHHSAVQGATIEELREGQMVEYEVGNGPKGPRAESVRVGVQTA